MLPFAIVLLAGLAAWWGVWNGQFYFDDFMAISDNAALRAGDWWGAAFADEHHPLVNRPLSCWSIAMDFRVYGPSPLGPHLTNLLLHLLNGCLLFAVVRAALLAPNLGRQHEPARAGRLALAVALLWVVHPLCGDAVAYATQRSTLLFSACLLSAHLATLRAAAATRPAPWRLAGLVAVACGMASKEDMVVAPMLLVLFERAFVLPTWRALRTRLAYFAGLAACWLVLAGSVALGPTNPTVGYATNPPATALQWLMTQAGVLVHYLRLVVVPAPLRGAYDWPVVENFGSAVLPGLAVLALLAVTLRLWVSRPASAFLGALFFLQLAPTSSVMPIVTEVLAERRMYLPMLVVLVPVVFLLERFAHARFWLVVGAAAIGLSLLSHGRVAAYATPASFWADAYEKRDPACRSFLAAQILSSHGTVAFEAGRIEEAQRCFEEAMECAHTTVFERAGYARILQHRGEHQKAVAILRATAEEAPDNGDIVGRFGTALVGHWHADRGRPDDPRLVEATTVLKRAVELYPGHVGFWQTLGFVHRVRGDLTAAADAFRHATQHTTDRIEPYVSLAELLVGFGRSQEVPALLVPLLSAHPDDTGLRLQLADCMLQQRQPDLARPLLEEVLRLDPGNEAARTKLRELQSAPR